MATNDAPSVSTTDGSDLATSATIRRPYRRVWFHDAQKHADTGIGKYSKTWTESHYAPGELDAVVAQHRTAQKEKNLAYHKMTKAEKGRAQTSVDSIRLPPEDAEEIRYERDLALKLDEGTGNSTVLLGSSKAGKSTAMMQIYGKYYAGKDFVTTLFSSSPQAPVYGRSEHGLSKGKSERLLHVTGYDPRLIKMAQAINRGTGNEYNFCFMTDDVIDRKNDSTLSELVLTLRNSNISSVICLQYGFLLSKMARANINNILLFRFNSDEAIEDAVATYLVTHFRRLGIPRERMAAFYKRVTSDHGFIYLHTASDSMSFHRLRR